jgi:hypothetical protein
MKKFNPYIREGVSFKLTIIKYERYELECYVFDRTPNEASLYIKNLETNSYNYGGDFYRYNWYEKEIKEDLIPIIDEVVDRNWGDEVLSNDLVTTIIGPEKTYFIPYKDLDKGIKDAQQNERMQMDTKVFRAISVLWLNFLENRFK